MSQSFTNETSRRIGVTGPLSLTVLVVACWALALPARGQDAPLPANPSALAIPMPQDISDSDEVAVRLELFAASDDPANSVPVKTFTTRPVRVAGGLLRVNLQEALAGIADGEYVAVVHASSPDGRIATRTVSGRFELFGHATAGTRRAATTVTPELPEPERQQERFWTKVAVAIGAGLLLIPVLF